MSDQDDDAVVICVDWGQPTVADSLPTACADCGRTIAISPGGREVVEREGADRICVPCARARTKDSPSERATFPDEIAADLRANGFTDDQIDAIRNLHEAPISELFP